MNFQEHDIITFKNGLICKVVRHPYLGNLCVATDCGLIAVEHVIEEQVESVFNYARYIGCSIEYENKLGCLIETEFNESKARYFNEHPDTVKRHFKAYKTVENMTEEELEKVFGKHRRLKDGRILIKNKDYIDKKTEIDVTEIFKH